MNPWIILILRLSFRCMETTPSLACANKCVFCWRHHSNPVGTEWKWAMDEPELILEGALENHYKMIKQMKGVPGVLPERYQEGFQVKHCALSLVGEPIMYPEINKYLDLLHSKSISSFMVILKFDHIWTPWNRKHKKSNSLVTLIYDIHVDNFNKIFRFIIDWWLQWLWNSLSNNRCLFTLLYLPSGSTTVYSASRGRKT